MAVKLNATLGISGIFLVVAALVVLGIISFIGITLLIKPLSGVALILILYAIVSLFIGNSKTSMLPTIILFIGIILLLGSQIQHIFEAIPVFGIIFRVIGVIL